MAVRISDAMVEALGLLIGSGAIIGAGIVETLVPPAGGVAVTQGIVEVLVPPAGGVSVTQGVVEVLEGPDDPLVLPDGSLPFDFPAGLALGHGAVLATEAQQRHTRVVYERRPRGYRLTIRNATGGEVELVRKALFASRGGAIPVTLTVPVDDAGPTRYRVMNAGMAGEMVLPRKSGGSLGEITLEIEEV